MRDLFVAPDEEAVRDLFVAPDEERQVPSIKAITARAVKARDAWIGKMGKDGAVERFIEKTLDKQLTSLLFFALGLKEDAWGGWRVDRTNGRDTVIGEIIRERAMEEARKWFERHAPDLPEPNDQQQRAILEEYLEHLSYQVQRVAEAKAEQDAQVIVNKVLTEEQPK